MRALECTREIAARTRERLRDLLLLLRMRALCQLRVHRAGAVRLLQPAADLGIRLEILLHRDDLRAQLTRDRVRAALEGRRKELLSRLDAGDARSRARALRAAATGHEQRKQNEQDGQPL